MLSVPKYPNPADVKVNSVLYNYSIWMRLLFNANSAISWREQVNFQWDDDEVHFVLDYNTLSCIFYNASSMFRIILSINPCIDRRQKATIVLSLL